METRTNSRFSLPSLKPPRVKRQHLRKYSWLPDVLRVEGSIILRIFGPVLTVTIFSAIVAYAWSQGKSVQLTNSVTPLLSVVVGLILVFRTSYDRYWEGRKCFSTLTANVRNLSRMFWVHVALPPTEEEAVHIKGKTPTSELTHAELKRQKIETLQLCVAFTYAVKHYLRGEDGAEYSDLVGVLPPYFTANDDFGNTTQPRNTSPASYAATDNIVSDNGPSSRRPSVDATKRVRRKRSKKNVDPHLSGCTTPLLSNSHQTVEFHSCANRISTPLPLVLVSLKPPTIQLIAHEISNSIFRFKREGLLETVGPAGTNAMSALRVSLPPTIVGTSTEDTFDRVQSMVDQMTCMERVANTPIPSSYGIHLKQCVMVYLCALPFTLVNDLGWSTVPIVTVVAFTLMGIEGIADEIEMPFGYDKHDLPLDTYCDDLKEEVEYMIERLPEGGYGGHGYDDGEGDD
ncbi:Bestrophin, RFP-TM, chloride channel-domain-containing protein [Melanogaster broomeanus]|nr:Bestrophin, RFP-TM, chloride channel-domain-containing protein [Melanogaster broomeanus]